MERYNAQEIEKKWQKFWEEKKLYQTADPPNPPLAEAADGRDKLYVLDMFPYPSGAGLHVGHTRIYTASDVLARYFRMKGYNVLHPMGWDAFGLPAENDAVKKKVNPNKLVPKNVATFKKQMRSLGLSYDWSREFSTADPSYYKWTQWLFLQFFKMGLLYQKKVPINWCEHCQTGLANEEVLAGGIHERCGKPVVKRDVKQWLFRITTYADRLLNDLEGLDWPTSILEMQRNWIGRSEGTEIEFSLTPEFLKMEDGIFDLESLNSRDLDQDVKTSRDQDQEPQENLSSRNLSSIRVFTTRPDTIFGVTALVLAPEHPLIQTLINPYQPLTSFKNGVRKYVEASRRKSELERTELVKEKTGVDTGLQAVNPANGEKVPIWVADYVIGWYGGGAVMLVPAHDQRDYDFAKKYDLPITVVVNHSLSSGTSVTSSTSAYEGEGILVESGEFSGLPSESARARITDWLSKKGFGRRAVSYKLRDWIFSRQRYWGEPIPLIHCPKCGVVPVPERELPVELPHVENYEPTGTGESPLAVIKDWVEVPCPGCNEGARRETDTMPNWAGSCWYFLRFADPHNSEAPFAPAKVNPSKPSSPSNPSGGWLPVDWYLGGAEHAVLHLLYARFWVKAMYDLGLVNFKEPFLRFRLVGMVQGEDGRKMSKSYGNIVNPDDVVSAFGADTLRVYEMFMGPFGQAINWNTSGVEGAHRFLKKVWNLVSSPSCTSGSSPLRRELHRLIKKVGEDIEAIKFNTAIAAMMEFLNEVQKSQVTMQKREWGIFLRLLAPFAPHITEELFQKITPDLPASGGSPAPPAHPNSVHLQSWPSYDPKLLEEEEVIIIVQVDGKVRDRLEVKRDTARADLYNLAVKQPKVKRFLAGRQVKEMYLVPDRLINFATEAKT